VGLEKAIREFVYEGDCVALGGVTHLIPASESRAPDMVM
jgi:hypothetical protein